jgi:hypothetical protein
MSKHEGCTLSLIISEVDGNATVTTQPEVSSANEVASAATDTPHPDSGE